MNGNCENIFSGKTIWFTGLSGSGKTTISGLLQKRLKKEGFFSVLLDGDSVRLGLNNDLGYTIASRKENIRRVAEIAKIINNNEIIVICAFISPTNEIRGLAKKIIGSSGFYQIFIDTPYELCKKRDVKGLYEKALKGDITNFTGISSKFERPDDADLIVKTDLHSPGVSVEYIYQQISFLLNKSVDIDLIRKADTAIKAAINAGVKVLDIYNANTFEVKYKNNRSMFTDADITSHKIILKLLEKSNIPVLSEEGKNIDFSIRKKWNIFWLVDPIDGTKEFVNRNGDFTINIALIHNNLPVLGIIYAPVASELFVGVKGLGAYKIKTIDTNISISDIQREGQKLPLNIKNKEFGIVGSRSFMNKGTRAFIEDLKIDHPNAKIFVRGSSLKICMVAEGIADIYPRLGQTMEWDTAAGHALLKAAGKNIYKFNDHIELTYNKKDLSNPYFIAK